MCVCVCEVIALSTGLHCITALHVYEDSHQDLHSQSVPHENTPSRSVDNHLCPSAVELVPKVLSFKRHFNIAMPGSTLGSLLSGVWSRGGFGRRVLREPAFLAGLQRRGATTIVGVTVVGAVRRVAGRRCCRLKAGLLVLRIMHSSQAAADERGDDGYLARNVLFLLFYLLQRWWW